MKRSPPVIHGYNETCVRNGTKIEKLQILDINGIRGKQNNTQWLVITTVPVNVVRNLISTKDSIKPKRRSKSTVKYDQTRSKIASIKRYPGRSFLKPMRR